MLDSALREGQTPNDIAEAEGLIPSITTRTELDQAEAEAILDGTLLLLTRPPSLHTLLTQRYVRILHRMMLAPVWAWAGDYRIGMKNIGNVPAHYISTKIEELLDDARLWASPECTWGSPDEHAATLHHRLVLIHAFPNGNGRHARLYADLYLRARGEAPFTWGSRASLVASGPERGAYLDALRIADANPNDVAALVAFARS